MTSENKPTLRKNRKLQNKIATKAVNALFKYNKRYILVLMAMQQGKTEAIRALSILAARNHGKTVAYICAYANRNYVKGGAFDGINNKDEILSIA